jgi:hypothetical protein
MSQKKQVGQRYGARLPYLMALLVCLFGFGMSASAQFDTGAINGAVIDPSGSVVPQATVVVTNVGTSQQTTLHTNDSGSFSASALPFGTYVVTATAPGFSTTKTREVALTVGGAIHVNLALSVSTNSETVDVSGTATTVNTENPTSGTTLNATQVSNLPVNGRDVSDFLEIAPGSVASTGDFQGSVNGLENIFAGLNITVDGQSSGRGDISGFLSTEGQEGARVTRSSLDSIQEIDFSNSGYSAETGHSLGPQMNIITKAGTNQIHGTVFEFFRNDALDSHDYFEVGRKQPLKLNQYGANLSGPIFRNKLFFFINYEGDHQRVTTLVPANETLSAAARAAFVPSMQPVLAQLAPLPAGCTAIPAPASCVVAGTNGNLVFSPAVLPSTLREDTGSIRLDYEASKADRVSFRYNINDSFTSNTYGTNLGQVAPQALTTQLGKLDETHTFSSTLLNQFSVGINRFYSDTNSETPQPLVGFSGFFTNLGSLPGPNSFNQITPFTTLEVFDSVTKVLGAHNLKFGTQIRVNRLNEALREQQSYQYASFSDLETNSPFVLQKTGFPGFLGIRNSNWDFYGQDNWRVNKNLVLNIGLRYDYNTVWREGHNKQQNFDVASQTLLPANQAPYSAPEVDFAPRVGFTWDVSGKQKTVVHGYYGLFYLPMHFGFGLTTNVPAYSSYSVNVFDALSGGFSIAYPSPNPPLPAGTQNVNIFPQHPHDPVSTNWLFGIQQDLGWNSLLTINYTGNRAQHMQAGVDFAAVELNPANTATSVRQNYTGFAAENLNSDTLFSRYEALQVQLRHNHKHLNLEANYSWSHEFDDLVNIFSAFSNPFDPKADIASGDIDVRNNLTGSVVYDFGERKSTSALERVALGGWQVSSIVQTRSGLPTNITLISGFFGNPIRPIAVPGVDPYTEKGFHSQQAGFNGNAFAVPPAYNGGFGQNLGAIPRNYLRGPEYFQWDFSGMKNFPLTERLRMQFRADLFNILNHPNLANPDGGVCQSVTVASGSTPASCIPNVQFGKSTQTVAAASGGVIGNGTARQAQFSLKLIF